MSHDDYSQEFGISQQWATFYLNQEVFGVRIEDVQEILMFQPLTPVPTAPPHIAGLLNLRGQIMPAIDVRVRLNLPPRTPDAMTALFILRHHDYLVSIIVDSVGDVLALPAVDWKPPPEHLPAEHRRYVFAICPFEQQVVLGLRAHSLTADRDLPANRGSFQ